MFIPFIYKVVYLPVDLFLFLNIDFFSNVVFLLFSVCLFRKIDYSYLIDTTLVQEIVRCLFQCPLKKSVTALCFTTPVGSQCVLFFAQNFHAAKMKIAESEDRHGKIYSFFMLL